MALAVFLDLPWMPIMQQAARDPQWPRKVEDNQDIDAIPARLFTLAILCARLAALEGSA